MVIRRYAESAVNSIALSVYRMIGQRTNVQWIELINVSTGSAWKQEQLLAAAVDLLGKERSAFPRIESVLRYIILTDKHSKMLSTNGGCLMSRNSSAWKDARELAATLVWMYAYLIGGEQRRWRGRNLYAAIQQEADAARMNFLQIAESSHPERDGAI